MCRKRPFATHGAKTPSGEHLSVSYPRVGFYVLQTSRELLFRLSTASMRMASPQLGSVPAGAADLARDQRLTGLVSQWEIVA